MAEDGQKECTPEHKAHQEICSIIMACNSYSLVNPAKCMTSHGRCRPFMQDLKLRLRTIKAQIQRDNWSITSSPLSTFNAPCSQSEEHPVMANNGDELICEGDSEGLKQPRCTPTIIALLSSELENAQAVLPSSWCTCSPPLLSHSKKKKKKKRVRKGLCVEAGAHSSSSSHSRGREGGGNNLLHATYHTNYQEF